LIYPHPPRNPQGALLLAVDALLCATLDVLLPAGAGRAARGRTIEDRARRVMQECARLRPAGAAMQGKPCLAPVDRCGVVVVGPFGGSLGRLWSGLVAPALSGEDAARG
jgi:hypothetical protein